MKFIEDHQHLESEKIDLERKKLEQEQKNRELKMQEVKALEECQLKLIKTKNALTNCKDEASKAELRELLAELEIRERSRKSALDALETSPEGGHRTLNRSVLCADEP
jgi:hypothetical protein